MIPIENSAAEMFEFFEQTPDLVCIASKDGFFKNVNPAVIDKLGYTKEELFSRPIASFIFPDDQKPTHETRIKLLEGHTLINFENRYITKDGNHVWLQWTSIYAPDKELVFAIAKDISERKKIEKEFNEEFRKFKTLAGHFKSSIEKDRKYFASELQEELAQLASVIKMDLNSVINSNLDMPDLVKKRIGNASYISGLLMQSIRKIAFEVSPYMLSDFGLNETLKWLCNDFCGIHEITCNFETQYKEADLTPEIQMDFFRLCQQSLSNVILHAEAQSVNVSIKDIGEQIQLSISDDGKGFDVNKVGNGTAFEQMRERIASVDGTLHIQSEPGNGTTISFFVSNAGSSNGNQR